MKVIPSLSEQGWINDPYKVLNSIVSYYLLTDASQSLAFKDNLCSLPYTYHLYINKPEDMAGAVEHDLTTLIERYFASSEVQVYVIDITSSKASLAINAVAIDEQGVRADLSKAVDIENGSLKKIIEYNNFGDAKMYRS